MPNHSHTKHTRSSHSARHAPSALALYDRYLVVADRIPDPSVQSPHVDINLAIVNAARGVAALLQRRAEVAALPQVSMAQIESLSQIASALQYAAGQVDRYRPATGEIKSLIATVHKTRASLLAMANVLVIDGILPATTIDGLRHGYGAISAANDCLQLAALFHLHPAQIQGRVLVTPAEIHTANDTAGRLLSVLRPSAARPVRDPELVARMVARDRLWTLFVQTWQQHVWRAGAWIFGRDVQQHVPLLGARVGRRSSKPTHAPAPPQLPDPQPDPQPDPVPPPTPPDEKAA